MTLKVPGATLPLGCAILSTRARTVRGVGTTPLRRTRVNQLHDINIMHILMVYYRFLICYHGSIKIEISMASNKCLIYQKRDKMIFDDENKVKLIVAISFNRYSKEESTFVPQNYIYQ